MNKNILYVLEDDISQDTGSAINERNMVGKLLEHGIHVLIPKPRSHLDKKVKNSPFLHHTIKLSKRNPFMYSAYLYHKISTIKRIIKQFNIQILVFRWGAIPIDILYFGKMKKYSIYLKHLTFLRTSQKDGLRFRLSGLIKKYIIKKGYISGADSPSFMTKKLAINDYKILNTIISKNGTEVVHFEERKREKDFIYIGRLSRKRNTDKLLEAFKNSDRKIDIYGFGEMENEVKEFARKYKNISFMGKIPFDDLKKELPYYKFGVDFTYVPTKYGKASYSQKIAQYLSFKLNVIAVSCEDNTFLNQNNVGVLVDLEADNISNIIDNIRYNEFDVDKIGEFIYNDIIVKNRIQLWMNH